MQHLPDLPWTPTELAAGTRRRGARTIVVATVTEHRRDPSTGTVWSIVVRSDDDAPPLELDVDDSRAVPPLGSRVTFELATLGVH